MATSLRVAFLTLFATIPPPLPSLSLAFLPDASARKMALSQAGEEEALGKVIPTSVMRDLNLSL
jgi:hypothetical protein